VLHHVPRFLGDDQHTDPEFGHEGHRFGGHSGGVGAPFERVLGFGPDLSPRLLAEGVVVLHVAGLEGVEDEPGVFHKALATRIHVDPKALVLDAGEAAAEAQDHAAAGELIEQRDLFRSAQGIVPRKHDHARAQQGLRVLSGLVAQPLHGVRAHRVVVKMVLDGPERFEAE
jgi:hypothetical protein